MNEHSQEDSIDRVNEILAYGKYQLEWIQRKYLGEDENEKESKL
jgi:hypothetical protein